MEKVDAIVKVGKNGIITLPEEVQKNFSMYVSFYIKGGDLYLRTPRDKDKWNIG